MTPDWPAIVKDHGPLVWRTAYRLLNDHADAADCAQRAFLAAATAPGPVRSWPGLLVRLTTARALEQLRTRYRTAGRSDPLPDLPTVDPRAADPLAAAAAGELADRLREALAA